MKPNPNNSPATSPASVASRRAVETARFEEAFADLAIWLDDRLERLEAKFEAFRTPHSLSKSLGR